MPIANNLKGATPFELRIYQAMWPCIALVSYFVLIEGGAELIEFKPIFFLFIWKMQTAV